jgi:hypothetical protein
MRIGETTALDWLKLGVHEPRTGPRSLLVYTAVLLLWLWAHAPGRRPNGPAGGRSAHVRGGFREFCSGAPARSIRTRSPDAPARCLLRCLLPAACCCCCCCCCHHHHGASLLHVLLQLLGGVDLADEPSITGPRDPPRTEEGGSSAGYGQSGCGSLGTERSGSPRGEALAALGQGGNMVNRSACHNNRQTWQGVWALNPAIRVQIPAPGRESCDPSANPSPWQA